MEQKQTQKQQSPIDTASVLIDAVLAQQSLKRLDHARLYDALKLLRDKANEAEALGKKIDELTQELEKIKAEKERKK